MRGRGDSQRRELLARLSSESARCANRRNDSGETREIVWAVPDDSGLHFAAQGIEFKLKGAPFDCTQGNGSDNGPHETNTRWTCTDKGGPNKKGWEYTVRLYTS